MTALHYVRALFFRLDLWVLLGLVALVLWLLASLARRNRRAQPQSCPPPSLAARLAETFALAGASVAVLAMLATYQSCNGTPYALSRVAPPSLRAEFWTVLAVWSVLVAAMLVLAWFGRTAWACIVLTVFFLASGYAVNDGLLLGYKNHADAIRATPVPLDITLVGDIQGADVWMNGVHLGKTPIHTTADEFFEKVPALAKPPAEWHDHAKYYRDPHGYSGLCSPLDWIRLQPPTKVLMDDPDPPWRDVYARVELHGQKMYAMLCGSSEGGSRMFGQIRPGYIRLGMALPRWEEEIALLVARARLADYRIDQAWINAAESYGDRVWQEIVEETEDEPDFNRVLDSWARQHYHLDGVRGPDSAMEVLDHVAAECENLDSYRTDSLPGRAVELLVPYLGAQQLVDRAARRIASFRSPPSFGDGWGTVAGRPYWILFFQPPDGDPAHALAPADAVLAHAIWKLDALLNRQDSAKDNLVEQQITPALIRLAPWWGSTCFDAAGALGGSAYEQFVLRHRWAAEVSLERFDDWDYVAGARINRWLYLAANLRSPAGRAFRCAQSYYVLHMAEQIVREGHDFDVLWPRNRNSLDFLFLDPGDDPNNLAVQFWPQFDRLATDGRADSWHAVPMRWSYLAHMQPYCTPKMFVDVYRRCPNERLLQGDPRSSPVTQLAPDLQFDVLTALVAEASHSLRDAKLGTSAHQFSKLNHDDFVQLLLLVPCEKSADRLVEWLTEKSKDHGQRMQRAGYMAQAGQLSIHHLRRLAKAKEPELRRLVLPPIQRRPTPARRAILHDLLKDKDNDVRSAAETLDTEIRDLLRHPLPTRDPLPRSG